MTTAARLATAADIDAATDTLTAAHREYAWAVWAFPRGDRVELLRRLFRLDLTIGVASDAAWVSDDCSSVAIWSPPDHPSAQLTQLRLHAQVGHSIAVDGELIDSIRHQQDVLIGGDAQRLQAADAITRPYHPQQPYWYLGTVGTRPERRGEGLATALLQPILDRCDDEHTVACLETSTDDNVRLYRRLAFVETFRATVDNGTLPLIVMTRSPR
ncbi:MAG: Puromycin N-acetyltransferase [Ilumatobacteraceae bacterium]|nr:Puromycin N-acetyltransferase [Ilumatobacteraceae bacterium]